MLEPPDLSFGRDLSSNPCVSEGEAADQLEFARCQKKPPSDLGFSAGYARLTNILARELLAGVGLALPLLTGGRIECQEVQTETPFRLLEARGGAAATGGVGDQERVVQTQETVDSFAGFRLQTMYAPKSGPTCGRALSGTNRDSCRIDRSTAE